MALATRGRKQLAIRRLLLDGKGNLNRDAQILVVDMKRFCYADGKPTLLHNTQTGGIDPYASVAAAARREVFDHLARMLMVDYAEILNAKDEGQ